MKPLPIMPIRSVSILLPSAIVALSLRDPRISVSDTIAYARRSGQPAESCRFSDAAIFSMGFSCGKPMMEG
jgi:hypothetical protein